ncbi:MAG TPA: heterodisulfide reductase-related iron-sulfur binding cluster [Gemmatimonadaceae bacterium]|nr:heterodisulfide reductase-related iron-sulfur binding cluster [Gemmatimonadaceae bacterium]
MSANPSAAAPCAHPGTPLAEVRAGIDACVHCGFCLQACPTYLTLDDENDSPRGRIVLMRAAYEGALSLDDPSLRRHIDQCLGCRGCETACPSGVPYGQLLEATRATVAQRHRPPLIARLVLGVFRRAFLLRVVLFGAKMMRRLGIADLLSSLPGRAGFSMAMLASTNRRFRGGRYQASANAADRGSAVLLRGCVMDGLFRETNRATERTLRVNGYRMEAAPSPRCCGALHAHAGDLEGARDLARKNIAAFEKTSADFIVTNAAGCGAMMKEYGHLLADDTEWSERAGRIAERVRDVSELLAESGPRQAGPLHVRVTYDAPCHLVHAQRIAAPPLQVLAAIEGLELVPIAGADQCCGSAGIYNLLEPEVSAQVLEPKLNEIRLAAVDLVATGNPGCLMQIGAGLYLAGKGARAIHPVDLLDEAYATGMGPRKAR